MIERDETGGPAQEIPRIVPVFPLPGHVFLPTTPTPYRIFEPRYRELMSFLLALPEDRRWVAIPRLVPGSEPDHLGSPPFSSIGTVGRLVEHEQNLDGTYNIVVGEGLRCRLEETRSPHAFRLVTVEPWPDLPSIATEAELAAAFDTLQQVLSALVQALGPAARGLVAIASADTDRSTRVYRLGSALIQHPDRRQDFLECRQLRNRIEMLLDATATLLTLAGNRDRGTGAVS